MIFNLIYDLPFSFKKDLSDTGISYVDLFKDEKIKYTIAYNPLHIYGLYIGEETGFGSYPDEVFPTEKELCDRIVDLELIDFIKSTESLGDEFSKVLFDNIENLYVE